ncbi:MAG: EFR1 family ferrodoxin [bacterium]|nr:EFR1 family ferrodoxin [bacterium]
MKTAVFYFTGTGNNLYIAKKLQTGLENTHLYPFYCLDENPELVNQYERIIYCAPVYYSHVPPYVIDTLNKIIYTSEKEIITIVACGGNRGHAIEDIRETISMSGQKVVGEYMIVLPGNYILSYGAFPKLYQQFTNYLADRKMNEIIRRIKSHSIDVQKKTGMFYKKENEPRLMEAIHSFEKIGQQYEIAESCVGCGICVLNIFNIHLNNDIGF